LWEHTNFNARLQPLQIGLGTTSTASGTLRLDYTYRTTGHTNNDNVESQRIAISTSLDMTRLNQFLRRLYLLT
jgi:hypothetical protein